MVLGITPALSGSRGIPNKNLKLIKNKPLIAHAIECAIRSKCIAHHIVSTDSRKTAKIATQYGVDVPFIRPKELATDNTPMLPVLQHAITESEKYYGENIETLVLLDPTAPLRTVKDV